MVFHHGTIELAREPSQLLDSLLMLDMNEDATK